MTVAPQRLPRSLSLQLTEACNLRCRMCYEWGETGSYTRRDRPRKPAILDVELVERVVGELAAARPLYSLFGGEPLLYPQLERLIRAIKGAGSFVDTPTNGTLLAKHAELLVETGFDSIRVSLDGPREIDDGQRGAGSYDKALAGIEAVQRARERAGRDRPAIGIIYTVTPENHLAVAEFFLRELDLAPIRWVTIQMQNYVTEAMGRDYADLLRRRFGLEREHYWRSMLRSPADFAGIDAAELARQVAEVGQRMDELGKRFTLLPRSFSAPSLAAYLGARWGEMEDRYRSCLVPWTAADITATGELAPCHVFYDLVVGDLHQHRFEVLWNGESYRALRDYLDQEGLMSICHGCCILYLANPPLGPGARGVSSREDERPRSPA